MNRTVAVVELFWAGHHPTYFKFFCRTLLDLGCRVIALSPRPEEVRQWMSVHYANDDGLFHVVDYDRQELCQRPSQRLMATNLVFRRWCAAAEAIRKAAQQFGVVPDLVFFAYLDAYLDKFLPGFVIDRVFPYRWSGLYFAPRHLRVPPVSDLYRFSPFDHDGLLKSDHCRSVALLDEGVVPALRLKVFPRPVTVFPDFASADAPDRSYPVLNRILEQAAGRPVVSLLGHIDRRKGILTLLDAALRSSGERIFYVIAGVFSPETFSRDELERITKLIASNPDNIAFHFGVIPDEASFNALVEASTIVFAAYEQFFYSSNLLTKAAMFHRPVIVSDGYCMAERVRRFGLGAVISEGSATECLTAIHSLLDENRPQVKRDYAGYLGAHSVEVLRSSFAELLEGFA